MSEAQPQPERPGGAIEGEEIVVADNLSKIFSISQTPRLVVDPVSFSVRRGELVALMGPSGCGKSTLLHLLGGLEPPDSGRIVIEGQDITGMDERRRTHLRREEV